MAYISVRDSSSVLCADRRCRRPPAPSAKSGGLGAPPKASRRFVCAPLRALYDCHVLRPIQVPPVFLFVPALLPFPFHFPPSNLPVFITSCAYIHHSAGSPRSYTCLNHLGRVAFLALPTTPLLAHLYAPRSAGLRAETTVRSFVRATSVPSSVTPTPIHSPAVSDIRATENGQGVLRLRGAVCFGKGCLSLEKGMLCTWISLMP